MTIYFGVPGRTSVELPEPEDEPDRNRLGSLRSRIGRFCSGSPVVFESGFAESCGWATKPLAFVELITTTMFSLLEEPELDPGELLPLVSESSRALMKEFCVSVMMFRNLSVSATSDAVALLDSAKTAIGRDGVAWSDFFGDDKAA